MDANDGLGTTQPTPNILIIDFNPFLISKLEEMTTNSGFTSCRFAEPDTPIHDLEFSHPDLALLGPSLGKETCLKCIHKLKIIDTTLPILVALDPDAFLDVSANSTFGGLFVLPPQLDPEEVFETITRALKLTRERKPKPDGPVIIGQCEAMREIRGKIKRLSDKDVTVLVNGESGTGKELIARSIHHHSSRNGGPLVKVNCATLPDELLESEIFGFQRGAFTDAHQDKPGLLEMANGGTLFIDEIGELSLPLQVKFLQVLEDKAFSRLGGTRDKIIDTRVVAATNSNLWKKVREGTFRRDLLYRLDVVNIKAHPLREIREDIPLLTDYFLNKYCFEFKRDLLETPDKIANFFQLYHWPGNVRELENVIRRAIALRDWDFVFEELKLDSEDYEVEDLSLSGAKKKLLVWRDDKVRRFFKEKDFSLRKISKAYLSEVERQEILKALQATHWNRKKAADLLQISYKTLLNRILEFDLSP